MAAAVTQQTGAPSGPTIARPACAVVAITAAQKAVKPKAGDNLIALCGGSAIRLGVAESFEIAERPEAGAIAVALRRDGRLSVLVIRLDSQERPVVEDFTRDLAQGAGANPDGDLRELNVDLTQFQTQGLITARAMQAAGSKSPTEGRVALGDVINQEAERLRSAAQHIQQ
jgi:hypothetical protein